MHLFDKIRSKGVVASLAAIRGRVLRPFYSSYYANHDPTAADRLVASNDLEEVFLKKTGKQVHKWHHYLEIYDRHLSRFRNTNFRMLEIGVFRGGSIEMWREYFGPDALIHGIDIDPACAAFDGLAGSVHIGSQTDATFLKAVVEDMGGVDVIIDDGSHDSLHIKASFDVLFPLLSEDGVYIVEDLHCAYWPKYSGGYKFPFSFINRTKTMIDDMHHWYHNRGQRNPATRGCLKAIHIYDSVMVFDKKTIEPPVSSMRPKVSDDTAV